MKLQEKILYCRKKAGISQEALAEQLGVSRQAVSKWETGDAVPEINKLMLLARAFGVTTDWLLSEDESYEEEDAEKNGCFSAGEERFTWVDRVPGMIGRLLRRYGWLFGVWMAVAGAFFIGFGALAQYLAYRIFQPGISGITGIMSFDQMNSTLSGFVTNNPVTILGKFIMIVGILMLITGIVFAVVLKKRSKVQSR